MTTGVRRVALIADVPNWAYHNIAKQLRMHLAPYYKCEIFFYHQDYDRHHNPEARKDFITLSRELVAGHFDIVHFFWRDNLTHFFRQLAAKADIDTILRTDKLLSSIPLTTCVYDHLWLGAEEAWRRSDLFNVWVTGYTVSSQILNSAYRAIGIYPAPCQVVEDGVDLELFRPNNLERLIENDRPLIIGWTGNARWGQHIDKIDHKGLETVIKPAIAYLQDRGLRITGSFHDRNENWLPYEKMVDYFNSLDVYVCASDIEGTATPVLEAMACGLPIISTRVGIVPQICGPLQASVLLDSRNPEALAEKIELLVNNADLRTRLSAENRRRILSWTWEQTGKKYRKFFDNIVAQTSAGTGRRSPFYNELRRVAWYDFLSVDGRESKDLFREIRRLRDLRNHPILRMGSWLRHAWQGPTKVARLAAAHSRLQLARVRRLAAALARNGLRRVRGLAAAQKAS